MSNKRVAIVTGATGGIGFEVAKRLGQDGYTVILNGINDEAGAKREAELKALGIDAIYHGFDVTDEEAVTKQIVAIGEKYGKIDTLVNNAGGLGGRSRFEVMTTEFYRNVMALNLDSVFFASRAAIPFLKKGEHPSIINYTSNAAWNAGGPGAGIYGTSKAGVHAITRALAKDLAEYGIRANAVSPGTIDTPFHKQIKSTKPEVFASWADASFITRFSQVNNFDVVYGGGESNVAVSLANYGLDVDFVTRLPENDLGECALMEMRKRNVGTKYIERGGERLGIYFLETGAVSRGSKVVYDRAHSSMSTIEKGMVDWEQVFQGADWFHWTGITPAISQGAADACLEAIQMANKMGVTVSTDLNYRKKLWKYGKDPMDVMPELVAGCDIILGNEEDAEKHFGLHPEGVDVTHGGSVDGKAYLSVLKQLMEMFPRAQKVITTLRGSISASHNTWSGVLYDGKTLYEAPEYNITQMN